MAQTAAHRLLAPTAPPVWGLPSAPDIPRRDRSRDADRPQPARLHAPPVTVARRAVIDVDVVVVSHRSRDAVLTCLDSLAESADGAVLSVTVVDNGSRDGTAEAVAARGDRVRVLDMGMDTGLATGANAGMVRGRGRYVLVLDPHAVITPGSLRTLVEFADRHPDAGAIAPRVLDGAARRVGALPDDSPYQIDSVPPTAMLVPRVVHAATAGFDEDFTTAWADREWCRRIRDAGYALWCVPSATVVHQRPATTHQAALKAAEAYHDGAYRYWRKHDAGPVWHPARLVEGAVLRSRTLLARLRVELAAAAAERKRRRTRREAARTTAARPPRRSAVAS